MKVDHRSAALELLDKYGMRSIPVVNKTPLVEWKGMADRVLEKSEIQAFPWENATGLALLLGANDVRCIDIDGITDPRLAKKFLKALGLPRQYQWVTRTGSRRGMHIFIRVMHSSHLEKVLNGLKSVYVFRPKVEGLCKQIELRYINCLAALPYSLHTSKYRYQYVIYCDKSENFIPHKILIPDYGIHEINMGSLLAALAELCILPEQQPEKAPAPEVNKCLPVDSSQLHSCADALAGRVNNYLDWWRCAFALAQLKEEGLPYFLRISLNNPKYPKDTVKTITKFYNDIVKNNRGCISLATLFHIGIKYGWTPPVSLKKRLKPLLIAKEILFSLYNFTFNVASLSLLYRSKAAAEDAPLLPCGEWEMRSFCNMLLEKEGIQIEYRHMEQLLFSSYTNKIDPLQEYFDNLEPWDGTDYITLWCNQIKLENPHHYPLLLHNMKIYFTAMVACVLNPYEVNDFILIFQGPENAGKTRLVKSMCPPDLLEFYYVGMVYPHRKDGQLTIVKHFFINLDEAPMLIIDDTFLNAVLSAKYQDFRPSYGHYEQKFIRRSSFAATLNDKEFLKNVHGSRRYIIFSIAAVDTNLSVPMNKVFSQALHLYKTGFRYYLLPEEAREATRRNMEFTFIYPEEELLITNYRIPKPGDTNVEYLTTTQLGERLNGDRPINASYKKVLGMALHRHEFPRMRRKIYGKTLQLWSVVKRSIHEENDDFELF